MKIYFLMDRTKTGGVKTIVCSLIDSLIRKNHDCALVVNEQPPDFKINECNVFRVGFGLTGWNKVITILSAVFPVGLILDISRSKRSATPILHLNSPYLSIALSAVAASVLTRTPLVYTIHANRSHMPAWAWFVERIIFEFSHLIIAELKTSLLDIEELDLGRKLRFIPFGVSRLSSSRSWGPTEGNQVKFVTVCRLDKNRYVEVFIESLAILIQDGVERISLKIVGDGSENDSLKKLVLQLGISDHVEFCPPVQEVLIQDVLVESTCFLTVSSDGEIGMAGKIAAGISMPCLCYDMSGHNSFYSAASIHRLAALMMGFIKLNEEAKVEFGAKINRLLYTSENTMHSEYYNIYVDLMK